MLLRQTLLYLPSQLAGPALQFVFAIVWTHWLTQRDLKAAIRPTTTPRKCLAIGQYNSGRP